MSASIIESRKPEAQHFGSLAAQLLGTASSRAEKKRWNMGDSPRSGEPVWRNSYTVGQVEDRIFRPINDGTKRGGKRWTAALLKAAKTFELKSRSERREGKPGSRNGAIGAIGLEVLEYLYNTVDYATGRLEPAVRTIADALERSYSAVHEALKRLRFAGFLEWIRRSKPVSNPEPGGPRVEQASNAYALLCPAAIKDWMASLLRPAIPACEQDRRAHQQAEFQRMIDQLTCTQFQDQFGGSALLGSTLKDLAAALDAQQSYLRGSGRSDETGVVYNTT